ncbi:MAG: hypothetical protein RLZZ628_2486 [Bacteroidota bacterium]
MSTTPIILLAFAPHNLRKVRVESGNLSEIVPQQSLIEGKWVNELSAKSLNEAVASAGQRFLMFHYSGHSTTDDLLMHDGKGLQSTALSRILKHGQENLSFVFLNGCESYGHLTALAGKGVQAFIVSNTSIGDTMAVNLATEFYNLFLLKGRTLKSAFESAAATVNPNGIHPNIIEVNAGEVQKTALSAAQWVLAIHTNHNEVKNWTLADFVNSKKESPTMEPPLMLAFVLLVWAILAPILSDGVKEWLFRMMPSLETASEVKPKWMGVSGFVVVLTGFVVALKQLPFFETRKPLLSNVTVLVEDRDGAFVMRNQGHIQMFVTGGESKKALIDDKGVAAFQNVHVGDSVRLKVDYSEPYYPEHPDSVYKIPRDGRMRLRVRLQHLGNVFGTVGYGDQPLQGVLVDVNGLRDTTDVTGRFEINIPEAQQRKEQEVKFLKSGFKMMTKKAYPQTNEPLNVILEK